MRFAHFFIDHPVFAAVLSIVTIICGVLAAVTLPVSQYPEIAPPTVVVSASYPGANARTVAETVATPVEEQVNGVENMLYMSSQSGNDGQMTLTVTFKLGTNLDIAQVQVQNRVALAQPTLPAEVRQIGVTVKKASPDITLVAFLYSPDNSRDVLYLSNYATLQIRDEMARLQGVGDLRIFGARDYSMRLWLDPQKLASHAITVGDVVSAVQEQNVQVSAGIVGGPPLPPGATQFQYTVTAQGRLTDPKQFEEIIVKTGDNGRITKLKDLARIELGAADYATAALFNGQPAVGIAVFQLPGTNSLVTRDAIVAKMEDLKKSFPPGLEYQIPYDTTLFVRESISDVYWTLGEAILLVVIVVLVFLQNWRASLVPLLSIPVSLIGTFAVMWLFGFSINNLSLFGLVLAIGIVVDDAIVVVENIERWIDHGLTPRAAAFKAMDEVTGAVIAIACGLSAVFIPVAFISGITGQFYRQFALTIAFSTLLSAFNSLTLSPALSAILLKPRKAKRDWLTAAIDTLFGWFFRLFNRGLGAFNAGYVAVLRRVVRLSAVVLLIYVGLIFLTYLGFKTVPRGFIPTQDQGYLISVVQLPDAAAVTRTENVMKRLQAITLKTDGVQAIVGIAGLNLFTGSNSSNYASMFLTLKPFEQRVKHADQSAFAILGKLAGQFSQVQESNVILVPPPPVRGIGFAGGFKMQVQDRAGQGSPAELQGVTQKLVAAAQQDHRLMQPISSFRANVPQLFIDIDRTKAKQQDVKLTDVFQTLQVYLGSLYINDFNFLGRTYRVTAQADAKFRAHASDIAQLQTRTRDGGMVPLGAVSQIKEITGPDRIQRYDLYPSAEIQGAAAPGVSTGEAIDIMEDLAHKNLPPGYSFEWTELAYQEKAAGNTALFIFPLCVLFVWLTHSAEYESFSLSTAIILIVPMCLLCGIGGVWLRSRWAPMDNNIFTQIGFVVLAGLSAKNAVLIVEFAKQQQEKGLHRFDAAIEAARLRLRPILMTSFAFILGVMPLVYATGAGSEMRRALGTAVFAGMLGVTFFGIFLTPVFYVSIRWWTERVMGIKRIGHHDLGEPGPHGDRPEHDGDGNGEIPMAAVAREPLPAEEPSHP